MESRSPAELALDDLLVEYRSEHHRYVSARQQFRFWSMGLVLTLGAAALLFALNYVFGRAIRSSDHDELFGAVVSGVGVPLCVIVWQSITARRARRRLRSLKAKLDRIGYYVACDWSRPVERRLLLQPARPTGKRVIVFEPSSNLDFQLYDRAF